jgi:hypothetical protein
MAGSTSGLLLVVILFAATGKRVSRRSKSNEPNDAKSIHVDANSENEVYESPDEEIPEITHWAGVAEHCPAPKVGDWMSETKFLEQVLRSFGKQRRDYDGFQKMQGFREGMIFDEKGMFAFTPEIKSVAIDVGAADNPLSFDLDVDATQVAFYFEPLQWLTLQTKIEADAEALNKRGGCTVRYDAFCSMQRFYVFPAAVSSELGEAEFHKTANPYCGSLSSFTVESNESAIDPELRYNSDKDISGIFEQCYQNVGGESGNVPTISLKALIERIPEHVRIKYMKVDAQGHDWNVLLSAGDQMSRIEYVRFEMQVDPPPGRRLVKGIPSYAEIESQMADQGFKHEEGHACHYDSGSSSFSKAVNEMECVFCRELPCIENHKPPLGENPRVVVKRNHDLWVEAGKPDEWSPPSV